MCVLIDASCNLAFHGVKHVSFIFVWEIVEFGVFKNIVLPRWSLEKHPRSGLKLLVFKIVVTLQPGLWLSVLVCFGTTSKFGCKKFF